MVEKQCQYAEYIYSIIIARCLNKIAKLEVEHRMENFQRTFQCLLEYGGKRYTVYRDNIAECYSHLASCIEPVRMAVKYSQQALSLFRSDPQSLEHNIDKCCDLLIKLYQTEGRKLAKLLFFENVRCDIPFSHSSA
jgi:hypothetical protein